MSDIFEIQPGSKKARKQRVCRVAYTLNNSQPVTCSIIGDQPFFYMDYEDDFDAADLDILEGEIEILKKEIETYDRFSKDFLQDEDQCFQDFLADKDFITGADVPASNASVKTLVDVLEHSRLAQAYLDCAKEYGVEIQMSGQIEDSSYDRSAGLILINPNLDLADQILLAARELRRHWQHRQGALIHPLTFQPDEAVIVNRVQVADLAVSMTRIAWELQLSGHKEIWERIENSSMADLGRSLAREAFLDFRTLNNGEASAAVFESWFLSERCRIEDKNLIKQMLADNQGYVFDTETAQQGVTTALISALGNMPYGKNYLAIHADIILNDPIFTDVRDRSNANFLWFIKFERSFRETEHELQPDFSHAAQGIRLTAFHEDNQEENYDHAQTAEIVTLYSSPSENDDKKRPAKKMSKNKKAAGDNVIYLRRWSGEQ